MRWWGRRRPDPLGDGVWRRAHDRFARAVDRYHQVLEPVPAGDVRDALERTGAELAGLLDVVRDRCARAQRQAPSAGLDVPPGPDGTAPELHRRISRAATVAAQAAESATMARVALRGGDAGQAGSRAQAAARAAATARGLLSDPTP